MDAPTAPHDSGLVVDGLAFAIEIRSIDGKPVLHVLATEATSDPLQSRTFVCDVSSGEAAGLTRLRPTIAELFDDLRIAFKAERGCHARAVVARDGSMATITVSITAGALSLSFELVMRAQQLSLEDKVALITRELSALKAQEGFDSFSAQEGHRHASLDLFHNGLGVVNARGGGQHDSVTTGTQYTKGQHYLEFRVVRCVNNYCMLGVQEQLGALRPYPGSSAFLNGKAIYGANGHCYHDATNSNYALGGFGPGDYVGVLLDMNARQVTFSINGRKGQALTLTGAGYYFVANLHTLGDTVELLPRYCWHRE